MEPLTELRKAVNQIVELSEEDWQKFEQLIEPDFTAKNDFLIKEGQTEQYIHFICQGMVRVYLTQDGKEICLDFVFDTMFVSAYSSFLLQQPSRINIQALVDTQTLKFSHTKLYQFYESSHKAERVGRMIAEQAYIRKNTREISFLTSTAKERYLDLLEQNPTFAQKIPIKYLASFLGIEPESLSRIRRTI